MLTTVLSITFTYSEMCDVSDYIPDIKGNPIAVLEYTENLTDKAGRIVAENKTLVKKIAFNSTAKKIELVEYNSKDKPYGFTSITSFDNKKISTLIIKEKNNSYQNDFVYKSGSLDWDVFTKLNDEEKSKTASFVRVKEETKLVSFFVMDRAPYVIKKTYTETGVESIICVYYETVLESLVKFDYSDKKRTTLRYNNEGNLDNTVIEEYNAFGNIIKTTTTSEDDTTVNIFTYIYDSAGNWTQIDKFYSDGVFGGVYLQPVQRTTREISYSKLPVSVKSIEPAELFSEYELIETSENSSNKLLNESLNSYRNLHVYDDIDPLDDKKVTTVIIDGDGVCNSYDGKTSLVIRRKKGEAPNLYINWHEYLGMETFVTIRVGDTPAVSGQWSLSTDSKASFYPDDTVTFINSLRGVDKVVAQTTPYGENPVTTTFDVSELKTLGEAYAWLFEMQISEVQVDEGEMDEECK